MSTPNQQCADCGLRRPEVDLLNGKTLCNKCKARKKDERK